MSEKKKPRIASIEGLRAGDDDHTGEPTVQAWPGLFPLVRNFLFGARPAPKSTGGWGEDTQTTSKQYASMDQNYRWFRKDRLVRRCIMVNAYFSVYAAGFETELQATNQDLSDEEQEALKEKYSDLKVFIDDLNKKLNMDKILFISDIKRSIFGKVGWEIVMMKEGKYPSWLHSLLSQKLKPWVDKTGTWELKGFSYRNVKKLQYKADEVFYMTNIQLEDDYEGLSDVEPIQEVCNARNVIYWENYPEIVRTLWAAVHVAVADTGSMTQANETSFLNGLAQRLRAGKAIAVNKAIDVKTITLSADIAGLRQISQDQKEEILGNFGTPRFLVGIPIENRATAYAELEAYVEGTIAGRQNEIGRAAEAFYDRWSRIYLEKDAKNKINIEKNEKPPVEVKHKWKKIRVSDVYEAAKAVGMLWGQGGLGPLGLLMDYEKVWEIMDWDPAELDKKKPETPEEEPPEVEVSPIVDQDEEVLNNAAMKTLKTIVKLTDEKIDKALEDMK